MEDIKGAAINDAEKSAADPLSSAPSDPVAALNALCFEMSIWDVAPSSISSLDFAELGVPHAELCALAAAIQSARAAVTASAAATRDSVGDRYCVAAGEIASFSEELKEAAIAALDSERDLLLTAIDAAEATKAAALDGEAVRVDEALEALIDVCGAARAALQSVPTHASGVDAVQFPSNHELRISEVLARAQHLFKDELRRLPRAPSEPTYISFTDPASAADGSRLGRVAAPRGPTPADIVLEVPRSVAPGAVLEVVARLSDAYAASVFSDPAALRAAAAAFASGLSISAVARLQGGDSQPLGVSIAPPSADGLPGSAIVRISTPHSPTGSVSCIEISSFCVAGVPASADSFRGAVVPVVASIRAPLLLSDLSLSRCSPAVSPVDGSLFVPRAGRAVLQFSASGEFIREINPGDFGLSGETASAAATQGAFFLADDSSPASQIVALGFDGPAGRPLKPVELWRSGGLDRCRGLAVLPTHGVVFASSFNPDQILAYKVLSGELVCSVRMVGPVYLAADDLSSRVYMSGTSSLIEELRFADARLTHTRPVEAAGPSGKYRPLAVMPPAPGRASAHLVAGENDSPRLVVVRLPDLTKVHTHDLGEMSVVGLAGDPSGRALVVCEGRRRDVHVLPWPLPGMPELS